jgi:hypothetical protein
MDQPRKSNGQRRKKNAPDVETKGVLSRWCISKDKFTILDSLLCIFTANFGSSIGGAIFPGRIGDTSVHDLCVREPV